MTTDIARQDESSIEVFPPSRPPAAVAREMLLAHAEMMQTAHQLAVAMCNTQMVPTRFRGKADDGAAAILLGSELGLNPIQSLQRIIPIHGMPSLEARTMVALLKAKGYRIRTVAQSDESVTVQGIDLAGDVHESTWTIDRAIKAGYVPTVDEKTGKYRTNKNGNLLGNEKYLTDPQAMLKAKAQSEVCRDMAPEVLLGISYTQEELESERWDDQPPARPARQKPTTTTVDEIFSPAPTTAEPEDAEVVDEPEPGRDGGNEQGNGAESSSGTTSANPPADQDPVEPQVNASDEGETAGLSTAPEPEPAKKAAPAKTAVKAEKSKMRAPLEKRLFTLLGDIDPRLTDEERITLYQQMLNRPDVTSTDDLDDHTVAKLCDQLYAWSQANELNDKVRDLLNAAWIAAENAQPTNTEGN